MQVDFGFQPSIELRLSFVLFQLFVGSIPRNIPMLRRKHRAIDLLPRNQSFRATMFADHLCLIRQVR